MEAWEDMEVCEQSMTGGVGTTRAHASVRYWLVWSTCEDGDTSSQGDGALGIRGRLRGPGGQMSRDQVYERSDLWATLDPRVTFAERKHCRRA